MERSIASFVPDLRGLPQANPKANPKLRSPTVDLCSYVAHHLADFTAPSMHASAHKRTS
jgi:hypothetical protein